MAVTSFGTPTMVRATSGSLTGSWGSGQTRTAGALLLAVVSAGGSTASAAAISTPAGWTQAVVASNTATTANAWVAVYTKVAAGSDSAPAFTATLSGTAAMTVTLFELAAASNTTPADTTGTYASGGSSGTLSAMTVTSATNVSGAGEYAITCYCQERAAGTNTWNGGGGSWANAANDGSTSSVLHTAVDYQAAPASGAALAETGHWTTNTTAFGAAAILVISAQSGGTEAFTNNASTTISSGGTTAPSSGTAEYWTAASWSSFPSVSNTVTPAPHFHVADPAAPSELIAVLNTSTGLVVRGSEGSSPVAHSAGFTVRNVVPAGPLGSYPQEFNVRSVQFGAAGNNTTDDTVAIQSAVAACEAAGGGVVRVPAGTYKLSSALTVLSNSVIICGDGEATVLNQTSTTANGITLSSSVAAADLTDVQIRDLKIAGPGSGSGVGISGAANAGNWNLRALVLRNLQVTGFGSNGVSLTSPITSVVENVFSANNGLHGFYIYHGTSTVFIGNWALSNTSGAGYYFTGGTYWAMEGCAADFNAQGYLLSGVAGMSLNGCGCESINAAGAYDGTYYKITGSSGITLNGCYAFNNSAVAYWVTGASTNVSLNNCTETQYLPNNPTASIKTDSGTMCSLDGYTVQTALALTSGTYNELNNGSTGEMSIAGQMFANNNVFCGATFNLNQSGAAATISGNGATVTTTGLGVSLITTTAARTGAILQAGTNPGQVCTVINQGTSANSVTFAASGTSNVADGTSDVIAGLTARTFTWDSLTSLWYRSG